MLDAIWLCVNKKKSYNKLNKQIQTMRWIDRQIDRIGACSYPVIVWSFFVLKKMCE